ncbi:SDR family oxidoreductase [Blastococcus sp. SYSU D00695]
MRTAVVGGTGVVGRYVVQELAAAGHEPVVLSRGAGVDVGTGRGLAGALDGVDAVIDVGNVTTLRRAVSEEFFGTATRNLLAEEERAGVGHHVVLSIVGIDRVDLGYYAGKRRQEELALAGPVPATVLRATQFHEFAGQVLGRVRGPVALVPRQRIRPVAARDVAAELVSLAAGPARGMATEIAGPEEHDLPDLARRVLRADGSRRAVVGVRLPGAAGRALATGGLLPRGDVVVGPETFGEWLAARTAQGAPA